MRMSTAFGGQALLRWEVLLLGLAIASWPLRLQSQEVPNPPSPNPELKTTGDYNQRLEQLRRMLAQSSALPPEEYHIGSEDLLEITVFDAKELDRTLRVSGSGDISLPLLGAVHAAGLTPQELESVLAERLRQQYMKEPQVTVFVKEMQSHGISVLGAVHKPGVFQIRGTKSLVEALAMAEGLAEDAGENVLVERGTRVTILATANEVSPGAGSAAGPEPPETADKATGAPRTDSTQHAALEISLKRLLGGGDPTANVPVYPGDVVKVPRAGVVYVVGEVKKPGGFLLKSNENISLLQALALAEGLTRTAQRSQARIIRTDQTTGHRTEVPIDLGKILAGKAADPALRPRDVIFIPNSAARSGFYRAGEAAVGIVTGLVVFRR
jgi:polysaccharide export outer membrane protein